MPEISRWLNVTPKSFWLWFGGIWLLCGLPVFLTGLYNGVQHQRVSALLDAQGRTVEGMVLMKAITTSGISSPREQKTPTYYVTFRFTTPSGFITDKAEVTRDSWDALVEREPIRVTYLPDAPQQYRIEGQTSGWLSPILMTLGGGFFASIGGFLFVRARTGLRTRARLEREGITTEATIVEVQPSKVKVNGEQMWSLRYRYQDDRGAVHIGTESLLPDEAEAWKEGDTGMVRYDRRRPTLSLWIGKS